MEEETIQEVRKFEPRRPEVNVFYSKSKDGRYMIVKTTITDIKPIGYFTKVLASTPQE